MLPRPALAVASLVLVTAGAGTTTGAPAGAATSTPTTASTTATTTAVPGPAPSSTTSPTTTTSPASSPSETATATAAPTASPSPPSSPPGLPTRATLTVPETVTLPGAKKNIPWPKRGRARLEVAGIGTLGRSGKGSSAPIASVTKVMTAYVILRNHPLAAGQNGPTIVVTRAEAASYARRKAAGESLVKIAAGERISQRQALQGLLIASGNNMADILARWDAGNIPTFVKDMNENAARLGLTATHYADTSGLNSRSRSSPTDLLKLAPLAMADPTFAKIVGQTSARIPLNKLKNTNKLLGRPGVIGIKTGSTRAAGGCLLFAAERTVSGRVYTVYGALLGAPGPKILTNALAASDALIVAARKTLHPATLIPAGRPIASLTGADGYPVTLALASDLTVVGWAGLTYRLSLPAGRPGQAPTVLIVRTSAQTITVPLVLAAGQHPLGR